MYGPEKCKDILKKLQGLIKDLFAQYSELNHLPNDACDTGCVGMSSDISSQTCTSTDDGSGVDRFKAEFRLKVKKKQGE